MLAVALLAGCANPIPVTPLPAQSEPATPQVVFVPVPMTVEVTATAIGDASAPATPVPQVSCPLTSLNLTDKVVVGAILPLSHPVGMISAISLQAALTLAVEKVNAAGGAGGKSIRLVTYDSGGDPNQAARVAMELITEECAVALVGGVHEDSAMTILDVAHRFATPFLAIGAMESGLTATLQNEIFRLTANEDQFSAAMGAWMSQVGDYNGDQRQSAIIVAENTVSGEKQAATVARGLRDVGVEHEVLMVDLPTQDYSSLIARIVARDAAPDVIFNRLSGEAALDLQRQLLDNGIGPQKQTVLVTSRSALAGNQFWQRMGAEGRYTVVNRTGAWPPMMDEEGLAFAQEFQRLLGRWPDESAFAAYDSIWLITDAISRAGADLSTLIDRLEDTHLRLTNGEYSFPVNSRTPVGQVRENPSLWHQIGDPSILFLQYTEVDQDPSQMAVLWPSLHQTVDAALLRP